MELRVRMEVVPEGRNAMRFAKVFSGITSLVVVSAVILNAATPIEEYGTISGRVLDADGRPVESVIVTAENTARPARNLPRADTNEDGEFTIDGLVAGRYELYTRKEEDGYPRTEFNLYDSGTPNPEVQVYPRQTAQRITLRLGPKAALLTGEVVDAVTRRPLKYAEVTVRRVDFADRFLRTGLSLPVELGEFELLVPSLPVTVKVAATGYEDWYYQSGDEGQETSSIILESNTTKHLVVALQRIKRGNAAKVD
jgi:carboxypeptidase family protein